VSSKEGGTTTTLLLICDANGYFKYVVGRGWRCRVKIMKENVDSGVKNGIRMRCKERVSVARGFRFLTTSIDLYSHGSSM